MEKTPSLTKLREARREFKEVKSLVEETHLFRRILKCNECGQIYFYLFYETVDWERGNDPQYTIFIPVRNMKEAEELNMKTLFELTCTVPRLQFNFVRDDTRSIEWIK